MIEFYSKIAGVTANNTIGTSRQQYIRRFCRRGMPLILKREPHNPHDRNAVGLWITIRRLLVFTYDVQIGYLNRDVAEEIARHIDGGGRVTAKISEVTGGTGDKKSLGVNILINKY